MDMPSSLNFINWFSAKESIYQEKLEKMICYFKDFEREELMVHEGKAGIPGGANGGNNFRKVSFERLYLPYATYHKMDDAYFTQCHKPLREVKIKPKGYVEEEEGALITDFANRYIGGGVMNRGYVQEEMLFLDYPELLMSKLICSKLQDYEAVCIVGAHKTGPKDDFLELDIHGRINRTFIAIDALFLGGIKDQVDQFYAKSTLRDLKKAYIGFQGDQKEEEVKQQVKPVSTGRWGCGAFNGNAELKFLIQWIA